jgi:hypothetical protein
MSMENYKQLLIDRVLSYKRTRILYQKRGPEYHKPKNYCQDGLLKGLEFEKFVVRTFSPKHFTLVEWRSDKAVEGMYPLMNRFPDLELYFESDTEPTLFAVECKWRELADVDGVALDPYQLENYRYYQEVTGHPTFIVLGIGNTPGNPNEVYSIPLSDINDPVINHFMMNVHRRFNSHGNFFLNCGKQLLT